MAMTWMLFDTTSPHCLGGGNTLSLREKLLQTEKVAERGVLCSLLSEAFCLNNFFFIQLEKSRND